MKIPKCLFQLNWGDDAGPTGWNIETWSNNRDEMCADTIEWALEERFRGVLNIRAWSWVTVAFHYFKLHGCQAP